MSVERKNIMEQSNLSTVFKKYTGNKNDMDGRTFVKLLKDAKIIDKKFSTSDADIIFSSCKNSCAVKLITFARFKTAINLIAQKKSLTAAELINSIEGLQGPTFFGTQADNVKFHDDPSQYTGTHTGKTTGGVEQIEDKPKNLPKQQEQKKQGEVCVSLDEVFYSFTSNSMEMDGKTFVKLAKDCKILDKKLTATDIDLIFAKVKVREQRKIDFVQFQSGLHQSAEKKGISYDELVKQIFEHGGPTFTGTKADHVKFHDDKSLYTGVYARGGPTNVDKYNIRDISQTYERSAADVRGFKQFISQDKDISTYQKVDDSLQADFNLLKLPDKYLQLANQQGSQSDEESKKIANKLLKQSPRKISIYNKKQDEIVECVEPLTNEEIFIQTQNSEMMSFFKNEHKQKQNSKKQKQYIIGKKLIDSLQVQKQKIYQNNQCNPDNNYDNHISSLKESPYQRQVESFYNQNSKNNSYQQYLLQNLICPSDGQRPEEIQNVFNQYDTLYRSHNFDELIKDLFNVTENFLYNKTQELNQKFPNGQKKLYKPNNINEYKKLVQMSFTPPKEKHYQGSTQNRLLNFSLIKNPEIQEQNQNNPQINLKLTEYQMQKLNNKQNKINQVQAIITEKQNKYNQQNNPINQDKQEQESKLILKAYPQNTNNPKTLYEQGMEDFKQEIKRMDDILQQNKYKQLSTQICTN